MRVTSLSMESRAGGRFVPYARLGEDDCWVVEEEEERDKEEGVEVVGYSKATPRLVGKLGSPRHKRSNLGLLKSTTSRVTSSTSLATSTTSLAPPLSYEQFLAGVQEAPIGMLETRRLRAFDARCVFNSKCSFHVLHTIWVKSPWRYII